jgi:peptidoglycan/LPS O-acetylase OafA/YrhL
MTASLLKAHAQRRAHPPAPAATQAPAHHHAYRPDVDGLRAIAVLAVVIFHAAPDLVTGGFAGVDVFFVISGYLISGIILRALAQDNFSLLDFYVRRARRIFPALVLMLGAVLAAGWLVLLPDEYKRLGKHVYSGAGFVLNLVLFNDTKEYFGAITSPLIHLWSLGVEEQFYLLWPLFLMLTRRAGKAQLLLIGLAAAASFGLNVATVKDNPLAAFYLPSSRLWELALGALLAGIELRARQPGTSAAGSALDRLANGNVRGVLGALLVLGSLAGLDQGMAFPGWWALAPAGGAFLLISAGPSSWFNRIVLSHPVMVYVGLISYPLYLWHWPMLSFAHSLDWRAFTPLHNLLPIALSFVLAHLTYKLVESPIRRSPRARPIALALCVLLAIGGGAGYLLFTQKIGARPVSAEVARFNAAATEELPFPDEEEFLTVVKGGPRTLFIGDSTLAQYHTRVAKVLEQQGSGRGAVFAWRAGCAPDTAMSLVDPAACDALLKKAVEYARDPQVDTVVIGFCWYAYFTGILDTDRVGNPGPMVAGTDRALDNIRRMVAELTRQNKRVYLVLQSPLDPGFHPRQMISRSLAGGFGLDVRAAPRADMERTFEPFVSKLRAIAAANGAALIDPVAGLCDAASCPAVTPQNAPIYRDAFHLRKDFIREHALFIDQTVSAPGAGR